MNLPIHIESGCRSARRRYEWPVSFIQQPSQRGSMNVGKGRNAASIHGRDLTVRRDRQHLVTWSKSNFPFRHDPASSRPPRQSRT